MAHGQEGVEHVVVQQGAPLQDQHNSRLVFAVVPELVEVQSVSSNPLKREKYGWR